MPKASFTQRVNPMGRNPPFLLGWPNPPKSTLPKYPKSTLQIHRSQPTRARARVTALPQEKKKRKKNVLRTIFRSRDLSPPKERERKRDPRPEGRTRSVGYLTSFFRRKKEWGRQRAFLPSCLDPRDLRPEGRTRSVGYSLFFRRKKREVGEGVIVCSHSLWVVCCLFFSFVCV